MTATEPVYWEPFEARFAIDPYPTYARLREEFEAKLAAAVQDGDAPDPRDAQIGRLKAHSTTLTERLARQDAVIAELSDFKTQALSRIAAQHDEIARLRREVQQAVRVRRLPVPVRKESLS